MAPSTTRANARVIRGASHVGSQCAGKLEPFRTCRPTQRDHGVSTTLRKVFRGNVLGPEPAP